jgi:hypothetical protein
VPSAFDTEADIENMTDEEVEQAAKGEAADEKVISFNRAKENSVVYEQLPEGFDAKQLQTQHPNSNVQTMVDFLANRCAASMGLSKVFATQRTRTGAQTSYSRGRLYRSSSTTLNRSLIGCSTAL